MNKAKKAKDDGRFDYIVKDLKNNPMLARMFVESYDAIPAWRWVIIRASWTIRGIFGIR